MGMALIFYPFKILPGKLIKDKFIGDFMITIDKWKADGVCSIIEGNSGPLFIWNINDRKEIVVII